MSDTIFHAKHSPIAKMFAIIGSPGTDMNLRQQVLSRIEVCPNLTFTTLEKYADFLGADKTKVIPSVNENALSLSITYEGKMLRTFQSEDWRFTVPEESFEIEAISDKMEVKWMNFKNFIDHLRREYPDWHIEGLLHRNPEQKWSLSPVLMNEDGRAFTLDRFKNTQWRFREPIAKSSGLASIPINVANESRRYVQVLLADPMNQ
jgi:hypothetical protein